MGVGENPNRIHVDSGSGMFWLMGWLFTIAFAGLSWSRAILALALWPYYLGMVLR